MMHRPGPGVASEPVEQVVGDLRLGARMATAPAARPGTMMVTRFVSRAEAEPGSETSLATRRSTPLRAAFSGARSSDPVSAAKPTMSGRRGALGGLARARVAASARMSVGGLELEVQSVGAGELHVRGLARPEVGHRGGHDEGVAAGQRRAGRPRACAPAVSASTIVGARRRLARSWCP